MLLTLAIDAKQRQKKKFYHSDVKKAGQRGTDHPPAAGPTISLKRIYNLFLSFRVPDRQQAASIMRISLRSKLHGNAAAAEAGWLAGWFIHLGVAHAGAHPIPGTMSHPVARLKAQARYTRQCVSWNSTQLPLMEAGSETQLCLFLFPNSSFDHGLGKYGRETPSSPPHFQWCWPPLELALNLIADFAASMIRRPGQGLGARRPGTANQRRTVSPWCISWSPSGQSDHVLVSIITVPRSFHHTCPPPYVCFFHLSFRV